ncbi:hypothetical protein [Nocardia altamirensis]|uniref:hypothetical protein n=1 Tax=Nocardia altamirensis TaxID=472158 RepID=UPI0008402EA9|nr:hypothetical protein [Nocardia altamirensis]
MSPSRKTRASAVACSSKQDGAGITPATPADDRDASATENGPTTDSGKQATQRPGAREGTPGQGLALIGPTSEATRRMVAESRARQGLTPYINDPHVIESLALFLRHALDTLDRDSGRGDR